MIAGPHIEGLNMSNLPLLLGDMDEMIPIIAIGGGLLVAVVGIVSGVVKSVMQTRAREESRREIAAYVAEGSISAQDAKEMLEAGRPAWEKAGFGQPHHRGAKS